MSALGRQITALLSRLLKNGDGGMAVTLAVALPVLAFVAVGALDFTDATVDRRHMQAVADQAALALLLLGAALGLRVLLPIAVGFLAASLTAGGQSVPARKCRRRLPSLRRYSSENAGCQPRANAAFAPRFFSSRPSVNSMCLQVPSSLVA